jgi:hypothetical protein
MCGADRRLGLVTGSVVMISLCGYLSIGGLLAPLVSCHMTFGRLRARARSTDHDCVSEIDMADGLAPLALCFLLTCVDGSLLTLFKADHLPGGVVERDGTRMVRYMPHRKKYGILFNSFWSLHKPKTHHTSRSPAKSHHAHTYHGYTSINKIDHFGAIDQNLTYQGLPW